jgi:tRNA A37 N6-isopentenylltransferase MiaA
MEEHYTTFEFQKDAIRCIKEINEKNKIPILVGGSNL